MTGALLIPPPKTVLARAAYALGKRRPYFHIIGADGSLYMARFWLLGGSHPERDPDPRVNCGQLSGAEARTWERSPLDSWIGQYTAARLHYIARADRGRDLHTHPVDFVSLVLDGWYDERLPARQHQHPRLDGIHYETLTRSTGSVAVRRATDRHTITRVSPGGCWTLFVMGPKRGSWGFETPTGFVNWRDYRGDA